MLDGLSLANEVQVDDDQHDLGGARRDSRRAAHVTRSASGAISSDS